MSTRVEIDSMGEMNVPSEALYGASTQRAVLNFPISGRPMPKAFIRAMGLLKGACATANQQLGKLPKHKAELIIQVSEEIAQGKWLEHFPVDVFQTGSCTSSNMNANEVIANRINQLCGKPIGSKQFIHPNDDVNMGQSSNDTMPSVLHISVAVEIKNELIPSLEFLERELLAKTVEWSQVVKIGRTHLMDATPLTLGQEFSGYAAQVNKSVRRAQKAIDAVKELAIGGTAVGTGINCHRDFPKMVCDSLTQKTHIEFREAANHFEAQAGRDDCVEVAGYLATIATSLTKIVNDVRLMASGPRSGFFEITLPASQPGSSIMPGKVNPVMCEMLAQVCTYTVGLCNMVVMGGRDGHFELNANISMISYALHEAIHSLSRGCRVFAERCIHGSRANQEHCQELVGRSLMLVAALNPYIGYDKAAYVAKRAFQEGRTLKDIVIQEGLMDSQTLDKILDVKSMTHSEGV